MNIFLILITAITFIASPVNGVAAKKLKKEDFAYGYTIDVQEDGAIYSLTLPAELYTKIRKSDLGDVAIFNSEGEQVPHAFRDLQITREKEEKLGNVVFFPLNMEADTNDLLSLSLSHDRKGTTIDIDSALIAKRDETVPKGYLFDLGEERENIGYLNIYWEAIGKSATTSVHVYQSDDLQHWQSIVSKATLVDLQYGVHRVEQRRVNLPVSLKRYLRIGFYGDSQPINITKVHSYKRQEQVEPDTHWVTLTGGKKSEENGNTAITFTSAYRFPVESAMIAFPDKNSIIKGVIQTRHIKADTWRSRCRGVFYSLYVNGETVLSDPCTIRGRDEKKTEWRIVIFDDGAGLVGSARSVNLKLGYKRDKLVFLARGEAPFTLAYGSGKLEDVELEKKSDMVLSALSGAEWQEIAHGVNLTGPVALGGEEVLLPPPEPRPWKTWLLWCVLLGGVFVMVLMAMNLLKELKGRESEE